MCLAEIYAIQIRDFQKNERVRIQKNWIVLSSPPPLTGVRLTDMVKILGVKETMTQSYLTPSLRREPPVAHTALINYHLDDPYNCN